MSSAPIEVTVQDKRIVFEFLTGTSAMNAIVGAAQAAAARAEASATNAEDSATVATDAQTNIETWKNQAEAAAIAAGASATAAQSSEASASTSAATATAAANSTSQNATDAGQSAAEAETHRLAAEAAKDLAEQLVNEFDGDLTAARAVPVKVIPDTAYTLLEADLATVLLFTAATPVTVTVPDYSAVELGQGFHLYAMQGSTGTVTIVGGTDAVLGTVLATRQQGDYLRLFKVQDTETMVSPVLAPLPEPEPVDPSDPGADVKVISDTEYRVTEEDSGKVLWCANNDFTKIIVPDGNRLPMGKNIQAVVIPGAQGQVTVVGDSNAVVAASDSLVSSAKQYAPMSFIRYSDNLWWLGGERGETLPFPNYQYRDYSLLRSPAAHFPLDEESGATSAQDITPNGHSASYIGSPVFGQPPLTPNAYKAAVHFTGDSGAKFVDSGNAAHDYVIAFLFSSDSSPVGGEVLFHVKGANNLGMRAQVANDGTITIVEETSGGDATPRTTTFQVMDGTPHSIAFQRRSSSHWLYIDGEEVLSFSGTSSTYSSSSFYTLGYREVGGTPQDFINGVFSHWSIVRHFTQPNTHPYGARAISSMGTLRGLTGQLLNLSVVNGAAKGPYLQQSKGAHDLSPGVVTTQSKSTTLVNPRGTLPLSVVATKSFQQTLQLAQGALTLGVSVITS